jgi:hypothetical protein
MTVIRGGSELTELLEREMPGGWYIESLTDGAEAHWLDPRGKANPLNQRTVAVERRPRGGPPWWVEVRDYRADGRPVPLEESGAATMYEAAAEAARLARVNTDRRTAAEAESAFDFGLGGGL